jgi:DNA adenine methylase
MSQTTKAAPISPPLKFVGGKHYLAKHIHGLAEGLQYTTRLHPFAGGLGEFWNFPHDGVSEVVGDTWGALTNFYKVLQDDKLFREFQRRVEATPFSRPEWERAHDFCEAPPLLMLPSVEWAASFFVSLRMSMMGAGKSFAPLSTNRTRRGMNEQASAWWNAVEGLPMVHGRLRRVVVENLPALDFLRKYDGPNTLSVIDPPYYPGTRTEKLYRHEMTKDNHRELLSLLLTLKGKAIVCGYSCEAYENSLSRANGWWRTEVELASAMSVEKSKSRRTETIWTNYAPPTSS